MQLAFKAETTHYPKALILVMKPYMKPTLV